MSRLFLLSLAASHSLVWSIALPPELQPRDIDAMIADRTCRWSNCNEPCSSGFVSVPRKGGQKDEMMWDHTQCAGLGQALLCCPANAPQPTCTWRGHHNNGKCKGGCLKGEAEVWTIKKSCDSGYQSACCTTNTPSIEAYANCIWEGWAPKCWKTIHPPEKLCPNSHPHVAGTSVAGFGGEHTCQQGNKRYCCKSVGKHFGPPAFTGCDWATNLKDKVPGSKVCYAGCPPNWIKLAVSPRSTCGPKGGMEAFCCQGYRPRDLPDYVDPNQPPTAPTKSQRRIAFENAMDQYMSAYEAGACQGDMAPEMEPWFDDSDEGSKGVSADMSIDETTAADPILGRPDPCRQWKLVTPELAHLIGTPKTEWSIDDRNIGYYWDGYVPSRHPRTSIADLAEYLSMYPKLHPESIAETVVSNFSAWQRIRDTADSMNSTICVLVEAEFATTSNTLPRRFIQPNIAEKAYDQYVSDPFSRVPNLGTILQGILRNILSLHYARWEYFRGDNNFRPGPMLELAYWIGPNPGVYNTEVNRQDQLSIYQDRRFRGGVQPEERDRWVVFHFHFDESRSIFLNRDNQGGHTYTDFNSVTIYHGHRVLTSTEDFPTVGWRVDFRRTRDTARAVIRCPWDPDDQPQNRNADSRYVARMLAGGNINDPRNGIWPDLPGDGFREFRAFTERLYREGYLSAAGFRLLIVDRERNNINQYGEMQAGIYNFLEATDPGAAYGHNFRLERNDSGQIVYNWDIPEPDRLPQDINRPRPAMPPRPRPSWARPRPTPSDPPPPPGALDATGSSAETEEKFNGSLTNVNGTTNVQPSVPR